MNTTTSTKSLTKSTPSSGSRFLSRLLGFLFFCAVAAALAYLWYGQQQFRLQIETDLTKLRTTVRALDAHPTIIELKNQMSEQDGQLAAKQATLVQTVETLNASLQQISEIANRGQREWILAEIEYLMRIAHFRLALARDVSAAIAALASADKRLSILADPRLLPVRQTLAEEITALKSLPPLNIDGALLSLTSIAQRLNLLPTASSAPIAPDSSNPVLQNDSRTTSVEALPTEKTFWQRTVDYLSKLAGVNHSRIPKNPKQAQENLFYLDQLLRLEVDAARYAALRLDKINYERRLKNIRQLLDAHYEQGHPQVVQIKADVLALQQENLFPELPAISGSLDKLKARVAQYNSADAVKNNKP